MRTRSLAELFISFFKIGLIAFGGGYAVLSLLQREVVERRRWLAKEELLDAMAISQSLPGIISVNVSTMVGYRMAGFLGALTATAASLLPTFAITLVITIFLWRYTASPWIAKALNGVLLGVAALIVYSVRQSWRSAVRYAPDWLIVLFSLGLEVIFKVNVVFIIFGATLAGFVYRYIAQPKGVE